jgi:UDP-N-acetylglucosamine--N-acetylmuramyl-(pentapeptide) pyrophosphoryl-undecaprenol N-acetylglucosamine transferase
MEATIAYLAEKGLQGIWQCGNVYYQEQGKQWEQYYPNTVKIQAFIEAMPMAYKAADLVIARAGAITLAELAYLSKPAILVPSPNVAADHQTKNAKVLADHNAAINIRDDQAQAKIPGVLPDILTDEEQLRQLSTNIFSFAKPEATKTITQEVFKLINPKKANKESQPGHNQKAKT